MAICTVTKVEHNVKGPGKAGKWDGSNLYTLSEKGAKRIDFIFKSKGAGDQGAVVADLAVGDKVELKIVKNGDYFNLARENDAIKLLEKGDGKVSTIPSGASPYVKAAGGYKEDPEKQAAIIRQNALTNATHLVVAMLEKDMFKKTATADILICEVTRIATEFVKFTSGATSFEEVTKDVTKAAEPDSDSEFGE